jgi:hypothetical protein
MPGFQRLQILRGASPAWLRTTRAFVTSLVKPRLMPTRIRNAPLPLPVTVAFVFDVLGEEPRRDLHIRSRPGKLPHARCHCAVYPTPNYYSVFLPGTVSSIVKCECMLVARDKGGSLLAGVGKRLRLARFPRHANRLHTRRWHDARFNPGTHGFQCTCRKCSVRSVSGVP